MEHLVTVIVPIFNGERYIWDCVNSITEQTYKNIEIILINDGSKDNTLVICQQMAALDKRIVVINKDNKGVGAARNDGLNVAKGEFIAFVDADDYLDITYIEKLVNNATINKADIVLCGYRAMNPTFQFNNIEVLKVLSKQPTKENVTRKLISDNQEQLIGYVWRVLFKIDVVRNIRFDENLKIAEDLQFLLAAVQKACFFGIVAKELYIYRYNEGSTTAKYISTLHEDMNKVNDWIYNNICKSNDMYNRGYHCCVADTYRLAIINVCRKGTPYSLLERIAYAKAIKNKCGYQESLRIACLNSKIPQKQRIAFAVLRIGLDWLYIILYSLKMQIILKSRIKNWIAKI